MYHCKNCTSVNLPRVEEEMFGGLGSSLGGCFIVGVIVQCIFFFYIILYHCIVDHFPWYESPFLFYSYIGWQGGARLVHEVTNRFKPVKNLGWQGRTRVSCSSLGIGASIQLTTEEYRVLEHPSVGAGEECFSRFQEVGALFSIGIEY